MVVPLDKAFKRPDEALMVATVVFALDQDPPLDEAVQVADPPTQKVVVPEMVNGAYVV